MDFQTKFDMNYTDSRNNPMSIVFPKERYKLQLLNQQHGFGLEPVGAFSWTERCIDTLFTATDGTLKLIVTCKATRKLVQVAGCL